MEYIVEFIACVPQEDGSLREEHTRVIKRLRNQEEAEAVVDFINSLVKEQEK